MKKKFSYLVAVFVGFLSIIININTVNATDKYVYLGDIYYYNTSNYTYADSYSASSNIGTYYKRLCDTSSVSSGCGSVAYCVEKSKATPNVGTRYIDVSTGSTFNNKSWVTSDSIRTGEVIKSINSISGLNDKQKYLYSYLAINRLLQFSSNSFSNLYINDAVTTVKNMNICDNTYSLPAIKISADAMKFDENKKGEGYYYSALTLNLTEKDKCGTNINYSITASGSKAKLYSDKEFTKEIASGSKIEAKTTTVYLKVMEKDTSYGTSYKVTVSSSSSEKYQIADLWKPVNSSGSYLSSYQALVTVRDVTFPHSRGNSVNVEVPQPDKMNLKVSKLDESGNSLTGAKIKLTVFKDKNKTEKLGECDIPDDKSSSCQVSFDETDQSATHTYYYVVNETEAPKGYILDSKFKSATPTEITLGKSGTTYFYVKDNTAVQLTGSNAKSIYDGTYSYGEGVCLGQDDELYFGKSAETCGDTPPTPPEEDPSDDEGDDTNNPGLNEENGEAEGGNDVVEDYILGTYMGKVCLSGPEGSQNIAENIAEGVSPCDVNYYKQVTSGNSVVLYIRNVKNDVSISKQNINGNEISGAYLKICSKDKYNESKNDCAAAKNIGGDTLEWMSEGYTKVWRGLPAGVYYLIETTPPGGYKRLTTAIEFEVKEDGTVVSKNYDDKSGSIIVKNDYIGVTISKQDITTSKELPGAKLYICEAAKDENNKYKMVVDDYGECSPVVLADGSIASWKSEKEPHVVKGLGPGSYYLVEDKAPLGYLDAKSIIFILNQDGTLSDQDGKPIKDNKIVMYDEKNPETGSIIIIIAGVVLVIAAGVTYYLVKKRK